MTGELEPRRAPDTEGGEVFPPTAEGVLAWVRTTRPEPPREDVVEYVRWVVSEGHMTDEDVRSLIRAGYHELAE